MKFFLVFNNFLKCLSVLGIISCSSKPSNPANTEPPSLSYFFSLENCSTGLHSYKDKSPESQLAYCNDLAQEDLNNFCAHDERLALINRDCAPREKEKTEIAPSLENFDKNSPHLHVSGQKFGLPHKNMEIKPLGHPNLSTLVRMQHFWVTNLGDFSLRDENENYLPPNADRVIQDFIDCGFSYDGPSCYEGEEKNILSQEMVAINGEEYLFTVFNYSVSYTHQFALFIEANPKSLTHAYLYSLAGDTIGSPSLREIISERAAKSLASISSIDLNANSVDPILEDVSSTRQKLTLTHIKMSFPQYRESILDSAEIKQLIHEITANTSLDVEESNDAGLAVLWLKLHTWIFTPPEYKNFLEVEQQKKPGTARASEAALLLASLGIMTPEIETFYERALTSEDLGKQARAFKLARQGRGVSDKILRSLINTLNHPNIHSAAIAYDILAAQTLNDDYVESLTKLSGKLGNNGSTYVFAYDLLKKINTPRAHNAIIAQLSHRDRSIRTKVYQTVDEILQIVGNASFTDASTQAATLQMDSSVEKSRFYAVQILDHINSPEANQTLIRFADQDIFYLRNFITENVLSKPDKIFTNLNLEALTKNLDPKYPEQVLDPNIKYLFRLGTPEAINVLLKYFNRGTNINIDDETRRHWMLEYLQNAKIDGQNAYELGKGIGAKYKDMESAFLNHLIQLKHFKSTEVLLEKLRTHPREMLPHFEPVFAELKNRADANIHALYSGDAGLNLGDLFMKSRYQLKKLTESAEGLEPRTEALINYYQQNNDFSMQTLLPLRTFSALKSLVTLMGINEEDLRHKIIAAVLDFEIMPRELWKDFSFHVEKKSAICENPDETGCTKIIDEKAEFLASSLSFYPETRAAAFQSLAWIFYNTKDQRTETEITDHQDEILNKLYSNILPVTLAEISLAKEMTPILYAETKEFFKKILEAEGPNLDEQFSFNKFTGAVLPNPNCKITTYSYNPTYAYYIENFDLVEMLPPTPKVLDRLTDALDQCPNFVTKYPELGQRFIDVIEYLKRKSD